MKKLDNIVLTTVSIFAVSLSIFASATWAQNPDDIELRPQKIPFIPKEYFIEKVIDGRKDKSFIGTIITPGTEPGLKQLNKAIILKGGTVKALEDFITKSLSVNFKLREVIFHLNELKITEEILPGGLISGRVQIVISFEMMRNSEPVKLVDYKGGSNYTRSVNNSAVIGPVLVKSIANSIQYFNTWINREASTNEKLAQRVRVAFTEVDREAKDDTLFYTINRPLAWKDFKSKTDASSRFDAEIFAFFSFEEQSKIENSIINVGLKLKIYVVRSFSWVKDFARNSSTLNHEQRHFDLVKIAAERFKKKINDEKLTVENYQGILSVEYLESLREMNRLQEAYDDETKHGTDQALQAKWNRKIDEELRLYHIGIGPD